MLASSHLSKIELDLSPAIEKFQISIANPVESTDIGLFTGANVTLRLLPAPPDTGIVFQRLDLPGAPFIPASVYCVKHAARCTLLAKGNASVQTVEHILSALHAYQIDNIIVQLDGPEVPIFDGSALKFIEMLEEAEREVQDVEARYLEIVEPVSFSNGDAHIVALPSDKFQVSYTLCYPNSPLIGTQFLHYSCNRSSYKEDIAPARTFSNYEEVIPLIEKGYIKGGSLKNAVVVQGDKVLNEEGTRFTDEMVRHKILDLIGDVALVGHRLKIHFIAIKTGHAENACLSKLLLEKHNFRIG